jgi:hypothetical protein
VKLSIILATRRRPGLLARTVKTTLENSTLDTTRLIIAADDDDEGTLSMRDTINDPRVIWSVEPREDSLGAKYNRVLKIAPADAYMVMVDYAPCMTKGFDEKILEAAQVYPDGYAFMVNHLANLSFSQMNAITHKLATKIGGIYPEHFPYWFVDHWFEDLAKQTARQVFVDVWMDCTRKQPTQEKKEPYEWGCLFDFLYVDRRRIAQSIINAPDFDETPARKAALLRNEPLIREWSMIINSMLQSEQGNPVGEEDLRYHRLKKKAFETRDRCKAEIEAEKPQPETLLDLEAA